VIRCVYCEEPATCFGTYEHDDNEEPACDDCCDHTQENGHCVPLAKADAKALEQFEEDPWETK
jgi:hypothetical protein